MPASRYRRPAHVNPAIEYTFKNDLEIKRGWRIDYNRDKGWFVLTCKRGVQMPKVIPQGRNVLGLAKLLTEITRDHDRLPGHAEIE